MMPFKVFSFQERFDDQNLNWGSKNGTWPRWIECWMTRFRSLWNAYYYKNIDENYLIGFCWVRIELGQNYFQWRWKCLLLVRLLLSIALASSLGLLSSVSKPSLNIKSLPAKPKNTTRLFGPISSITWVGRLSTIFRQLFVTRSGKKWKEVAKENAPCLTVWFQISTVNNSF